MSYISILNHSSSPVCQNGQRRMCKESFKEGLSTILTFSRVWMRVCGCERVQEELRGCCVDLYSVFVKFCEWVWKAYYKTCSARLWCACSHYMHKEVCIKCVWGGRTVHTVRLCACLCLNVRVCVSASVHNISHTILLQYFYTSGRTVSCIIVSLNLGKKNNVYLIVLFFVAEKTVQKGVQQTLSSSHFLISLSSVFFKNGM